MTRGGSFPTDARIVELLAHIASRLDELVAAQRESGSDVDRGDVDAPELLTAVELATLLRVDPRTLREIRHEKDFPRAITIGRSPRWKASSIRRWLAQQEAA